MKAIIIPKEQFDAEFKNTFDKLELQKYHVKNGRPQDEWEHIRQIHRIFHYEVAQLKDRLEGA